VSEKSCLVLDNIKKLKVTYEPCTQAHGRHPQQQQQQLVVGLTRPGGVNVVVVGTQHQQLVQM